MWRGVGVPSCIDRVQAHGRQSSTLPILRKMNKGGKNTYVASHCAHTKAKMFILMTATLRLAAGTAIQANTGFGVNEPNKRNANALKSVLSVRGAPVLCAVEVKNVFVFAFSKNGKGPRASAFAFACCPLLIRLHPLLQFYLSLPWSVPQPVRFFRTNARICWLQMNARTSRPEPWNWQSDVRCRPLLDAILSVYKQNIYLRFVPYANRRTHVLNMICSQPRFEQKTKKKNEIGFFAWIWQRNCVNAFRMRQQCILGLVTRYEDAHTVNICVHSSSPAFGWTKSEKISTATNRCLASHVCSAHNSQSAIYSERIFMFVSSFYSLNAFISARSRRRCHRLTHTPREREKKKSDKKIGKKSQRKCVCKYWDD